MLKLLLLLLFCIYFTLASRGPANNLQIGGRIIGGNDTTITDHPYQVSLEYNNVHSCGGVIIARTWILTTIPCVLLAGNYSVRVGSSFRGIGGQLIPVTSIILHPNLSYFEGNIALVQLEEPIALSRSAQIVRLPDNGNSDIDGLTATVTGWGHTESGIDSTVLQAVEVPIISHSVCVDVCGPLGLKVIESMLCAGLWDSGKDSCVDDEGGPLVIDSVLYGLVFWDDNCARLQRPGIYTNVGMFRDWITEHTGI